MKKFGQFINENNSDYSFRTEVNDVTVYGLEEKLVNEDPDKLTEKDLDFTTSTATVSWILQPDMRKDRIKSMDLLVTRVECMIECERLNIEMLEIKFDTNLPEFKDWAIDSQIEFRKDGGVGPEDVEIDYRNKKVIIN